MTVNEKVARLKGLMEGLEINSETKEGKVLMYVVDILEDLAFAINDIEDDQEELSQYIEEIDDDLGELEDDFYGEECDGNCDECGEDCVYIENIDDDDIDDDDIGEFYQVTCPSCGEPVFLDDSIDPSRVICPSCHAEFSDKTED